CIEHRLRRDVEELRVAVDEPRDEPRAGNAIDLRTLARHPAGTRVERLVVELSAGALPRLESAFEIARGDAGLFERGGDTLAHLMATHAIHDHAARARHGTRPCLHFPGDPAQPAAAP